MTTISLETVSRRLQQVLRQQRNSGLVAMVLTHNSNGEIIGVKIGARGGISGMDAVMAMSEPVTSGIEIVKCKGETQETIKDRPKTTTRKRKTSPKT